MEFGNGDGAEAHEMQIQTDDNDQQPARSAMSEFFRAGAGTLDSLDTEHDAVGTADNSTDSAQGNETTQREEEDPATGALEFSLLVILQPDNVRHRVIVTLETTIAELTDAICSDLKLNSDLIAFPGLSPAPGLTLTDTPLSAYGFNRSYSSNSNNGNSREEPTLQVYVTKKMSTSEYVMPNRIQVQVYGGKEPCSCEPEEQDQYQTIYVDVEKFAGRKPYLGGFRHKKTQQLFHHASAQTFLSRARRNLGIMRAHRETQTQELVTRSLQTSRESGTQMARRDLRLDTSCDRHLMAKPYFDSYQLDSLREDSALLIERLWRGYKARAYVYSLREQKRRIIVVGELEAHENAVEDANYQKKEVFRRMHPKTVSDFEVLYNELDKWRQFETRKVHEDVKLEPEARQEALEAILAKETKLLQTIDRLKLTATDSNRKQRIESILQFMARPKQWQMGDGGVKEVHTPFTIRAKELMDLYHGLKTPLASVDERLNVLLHVKWTVKEFECPLTKEIIELIDREADMLNRGRKEKSFEGLRKRLGNLFLQFIESPEFNPESAALKQSSIAR